MKLLKLDNLDSFSGDNHHKIHFTNIDDCINICIEQKINVFIIFENIAYFRKQSIKECVFNLIHYEKATMYILLDNFEYYHISDLERVKYYTHGIYDTKNKYVLEHNKNKLIDILNSKEKTKWSDWFKQHYSNMLKFIGDDNFDFNINPYDLSYSMNLPTFVKSRSRIHRKSSILLPLENLYIPNHYNYILKNDIPFKSKIKTCVWRGANSGPFFKNDFEHDHLRASRRDLILKHSKNENFSSFKIFFINFDLT